MVQQTYFQSYLGGERHTGTMVLILILHTSVFTDLPNSVSVTILDDVLDESMLLIICLTLTSCFLTHKFRVDL